MKRLFLQRQSKKKMLSEKDIRQMKKTNGKVEEECQAQEEVYLKALEWEIICLWGAQETGCLKWKEWYDEFAKHPLSPSKFLPHNNASI